MVAPTSKTTSPAVSDGMKVRSRHDGHAPEQRHSAHLDGEEPGREIRARIHHWRQIVAADRSARDRLKQNCNGENGHADAEHVGSRLLRQPGPARQQQRIDEIDCDRADVLDRDHDAVERQRALLDAEHQFGRLLHGIAVSRST
jgi:hypothetical protein